LLFDLMAMNDMLGQCREEVLHEAFEAFFIVECESKVRLCEGLILPQTGIGRRTVRKWRTMGRKWPNNYARGSIALIGCVANEETNRYR
jgi:hypothetical protein